MITTMALREPVQVVINAGAGAVDQEEIVNRLVERYLPQGSRWKVSVARNGPELLELARRAVKNGYQTIVAGGGDGTVSTVAGVLAGTGKTLGVLPLGTLNHFAKDLQLPLDLDGAMEAIMAGHTVQVDVGDVNGQTFINNSSGKWPAFVWAAISVLRRYPLLDVRLSLNGKQLARRTPFVFIGNNEYEMEGFNIGRRTCLDKGELSLYITHRTGRMGLLRLALRALLGGLRNEKDFMVLCTREIWIKTRHRRAHVALDGETRIMEPPLHYHVRPGALRVLAPDRANRKAQ